MENRGEDLSIEHIIEALNLMLTPSNSGQKHNEPTQDPFLQHLQQNLERLDRKLCDTQFLSLSANLKERITNSDVPGASSEWKYVNKILQLLHLLSQALFKQDSDSSSMETVAGAGSKPKRPQDAPPLTKAALSVGHLSTVRNALQFITSLGICPNLAPGVGIPLQHRSKLITLAPLDAATVADISQSSESNRARLSVCVSVLAEMLKVDELRSIVLSTHLNDILAALLQLLHTVPSTEKMSFKQKESQTETAKQDPQNASKSPTMISPQQLQSCANSKPRSVASDGTADSVPPACEKTERDMTKVCASAAGDVMTTVNYREILEKVMDSVSQPTLIRELMVLQAGVPRQIQIARNPGSQVVVPPGWLKKSCSQLLFTLAKGRQGIQHLHEAISAGSDPRSPVAWKHCGTVAKIISGYPVPSQSLDQYVANISKQLTDLLHSEGRESSMSLQLVGTVACAMTVKHRETFFRHFHRPLLQPLLCCLDRGDNKEEGTVAVSEESLTQCLGNLHKVHVRGQQPLSDILCALQPARKVLWALFCLTHSAVFSIKQWVRDLLLSHLKWLGHTEAAQCLHDHCIGQGPSAVPLAVRFEAGSRGGLQAVYSKPSCECGLSEEQKVAAVVSILQDLKKDGVAGELLVTLLKEMTEMITKETQQSDIVLPASALRSEVREEKQGELMRRVTVLHLLASICETFGSECLSDNTHILLFVKASLERGVAVCGGTTDEEMAVFETETMSMAMGLLTAVMAGAVEMKEDDQQLMDSMLPLLDVIGQGHSDEFIREMASDIRVAIATRGAVWSSLQQSKKAGSRDEQEGTGGREKPAAPSNNRDTSCPLIETSLSEELTHPTRIPPPSKPLIEVLSDLPAPSSETQTQETPSSAARVTVPESPTKAVTSENRHTVELSPSEVKKSLLSSQTETSTGDKRHTLESSPSEVKKTSPSSQAETLSSETVRKDVVSVTDSDQTTIHEVPTSSKDTEVADLPEQQDSPPPQAPYSEEPGKQGQSPLQTVFQELCDPLLPVRGHALISLARLVQEGDAETLSQNAVVQKVFEENLRHGDSYLYLAAINGLTALSNRFPESVLPSLANEFAGFGRQAESQLTAEHRVKVGEALMKATRNLGEMIPKYRELLLGAVLTGARDKDVTVRASSVSNLAEVCSLLRFSLGPVLHEVLHCCSSLVETDETIVRQAAALTLAKLLEGLGSDCFTVLESVLPRLYRLLKKVSVVEEDEAVRLHAHTALDHLDRVTRDFAFPRQALQKKIQVLSDADTFR
ncbi:transport and Golgi organization protein 6 homolog [Babylonia areolata]|uniref:transport and Golgi organization protein 6 homolog n=1 Tax=Babylonia areolata TaxID=304850 RepID=UPI003FD6A1E8